MSKNHLKNNALKKHVGAIHIRNRLTLLQRKVANILLLNAYEHLLDHEYHSISVKQLSDAAGFESKDVETLKRALTSLAETAIEWNLLDDKGKDVWRVSSMIAEAEITNGTCRYAYSRVLRQKLFNPDIYARINLAIQRRFSSGHALALYENCTRFRSTGSTGWWELILFRRLMGIEDKEYPNFKDLNKRVIKPAIQQINQQSDIFIDIEYKREKRRIVALKFTITNNPQLPLQLTVKEQILSTMEDEILIDPLPSSSKTMTPSVKQPNNVKFIIMEDEDNDHTQKRLKEFGLANRDAVKWLNDKGIEYVNEILDIVECDYRAGKVKSLPAYTIVALRDDFRPKTILLKDDHENRANSDKSNNQKNADLRNQAIDTLEALKKDYQRTQLETAIECATEEERTDLETTFWEAHRGNPLIKRYRKQGLQHPVVQSVFLAYAREKLIPDIVKLEQDDAFDAFVSSRNEKLADLLFRTEGD